MRLWCRAGVVSTIGACLMLVAPTARAADVTELSWSAPAACPAREAVVARVERYLGGPIDQPRQQILHIAAAVTQLPNGLFSATVTVQSNLDAPPRVLENADCTKLSQGVALVVALAIDPEAAAAADEQADSNAEPSVEPPAAPLAPAAPQPPAPPEPLAAALARPPAASVSRARRGARWSGGIVGLMSAGDLPGVGAGLSARGGVGTARVRVLVSGYYWLPRLAAAPGRPNVGVELTMLAGSLKLCRLTDAGRLTLAACLGPELGSMAGTGKGLEGGDTERDRWSSVQAELSLKWPFQPWLGALLGVELGRALETPSFGFRLNGKQQELFQSSGWNGRLFLGLEFF